MWNVLAAVLVVTILLSGIYPAILLSGFNPLSIFRNKGILYSAKRYFQKSLIVAQFTFSMALIIGAIIIFKQLNFIQRTDKRYDRSQVFSISLPKQFLWLHYTSEARINLIATFKNRLLTKTGIQAVSIGSPITDVNTYSASNIDWEGHDKGSKPVIASLNADDNFEKIFSLQLTEGRWFNPVYKEEHNFLLNETALKEFKLFKPVLGQRFVFAGDTGQVIGVVKDFHFNSLRNKIAPLIIYNKPERGFNLLVKTMPGSQAQALSAAKAEWKDLLPGQSFDYTFMDEAFDSLYKKDKKTSELVLFFAIITGMISALGLFGLVAFTSEQRTKEIGIRKILGASVGSLIELLSKEFLALVFISIVIASPISWFVMNKWLQNFAYRINIGWLVFAMAGAIAIITALIAVNLHVIKAAVANPVKSLRTE
jgi:ABC-type antimicrobial peptide transport system permease subunit